MSTLPTDRGRVASGRSAVVVGVAIFLSRIAGLIRERVFAHYFGNSVAADAFKAALRIPNLLQNLFGEGVLSASFIPVYARLRAQGQDEEASQVASRILNLLTLLVAVLVAVGVLVTPGLIGLIAPGFEGERRDAAIRLVRILFPGTGLLVISAWCLGVLNSHRRFFLSYVAPVVWNAAQIGVLLAVGGRYRGYDLAAWAAWGVVLGSILQLGIQLPKALRLLGGAGVAAHRVGEHVREVLRNVVPVFLGRGVIQISAYVDSILASWLPHGAVAALAYTQILYTLPISLFGMSISAAELPEMASTLGTEQEVHASLRERLRAALVRIAYFIAPTAVGFVALGDRVVAVVFQTGQFTHHDAEYVWTILAGATIGLGAATMGRLYASTFYALRDTKTPLRFAMVRLGLTATLGAVCALLLPGWVGLDPRWGAVGLTASSGIAGWLEFLLLRRALHRRIGAVSSSLGLQTKLWSAALVAGSVAWRLSWVIDRSAPSIASRPVLVGIVVLGAFGLVYLVATLVLGVPMTRALLGGLLRRLGYRGN